MPSDTPIMGRTYIEGGWGWACVLGRFVVMAMTLGLYKGFGVLMPYFISDLGSSAMGAGASTSVFGGIFFVLGKYTAV